MFFKGATPERAEFEASIDLSDEEQVLLLNREGKMQQCKKKKIYLKHIKCKNIIKLNR